MNMHLFMVLGAVESCGYRHSRDVHCGFADWRHIGLPAVWPICTFHIKIRFIDGYACMQMGTAEDIRRAEVYRITVSLKDGLWMYCLPRCALYSAP